MAKSKGAGRFYTGYELWAAAVLDFLPLLLLYTLIAAVVLALAFDPSWIYAPLVPWLGEPKVDGLDYIYSWMLALQVIEMALMALAALWVAMQPQEKRDALADRAKALLKERKRIWDTDPDCRRYDNREAIETKAREKVMKEKGFMGLLDSADEMREKREALKEKADAFPAKMPTVAFDDVIGMEDLKAKLRRTVLKFTSDDGNGILLTGEPGNGKTFMVEALAGELGYSLIHARAGEMVSMWIGQTSERVMEVFDAAIAQAPCILFFDEIDSLLSERSGMGGGSSDMDMQRTVNALMTRIADMNRGFADHQVLIVAATNHYDKLDQAGRREGRFDVKIEVPPPDPTARIGLLREGLKGLRVNDEELARMADRWEGYPVSRLRAIARMARDLVAEKGPNAVVDADLLREALREVQGSAGTRLAENTLDMQDMVFRDDVRRDLDTLVTILKAPEDIEALGGTVPRGAVFYGPPGTGKTAVAKALAKATGLAFLPVSGTDLAQDAKQIDKLIDKAMELRPAIVFIDEAEGILGNRELAAAPYLRDATNKLLALMDGAKPLHDVFFVAATNHPDQLDPAMLRGGRLSEHIDFTPDASVVRRIAEQFMAAKAKVNWKGSLDAFVERIGLISPADVIALLNKAITQAAVAAHAQGLKQATVNLDEVGV